MKYLQSFLEQQVKLPDLTSARSDNTSTGPRPINPLNVKKRAQREKVINQKIANNELNADGSPLTKDQLQRKKAFEEGKLAEYWKKKGIQFTDPNKETFTSEEQHDLLVLLEFGTYFIPLVGPFISSGFTLLDAGLYYKEGDKYMAGLCLMFSMLPGCLSLTKKIPGIKQLGRKGLFEVLQKFKSKKPFTKTEKEFVESLVKNSKLVMTETEKAIQEMAKKLLKETKGSLLKRLTVGGLAALAPLAGTLAIYGIASIIYDVIWSQIFPEHQIVKK